ncbi:uncharacterized protein P884DRAFT_306623 [Thermothelomyces heterothallicus CBS 202.75]|uniref:uncharacterized protein n=1 Tax=Thermothelomyces heterothallicus CBS 202.75 TaxID=1149848 RepID=UPI00374359D3
MVAFLAVYLFPAAFPARDLFPFSALLEMMKPVFVQVGQPMRWRLSTLVEMWSRCTRCSEVARRSPNGWSREVPRFKHQIPQSSVMSPLGPVRCCWRGILD